MIYLTLLGFIKSELMIIDKGCLMNKENMLVKYFMKPLFYGLCSLVCCYFMATVITQLVFIFPHYSYTKEGSFSILLSFLIGPPLGIIIYFIFLFVESMKKKIFVYWLTIFILFLSLTIFDLLNGSCSSFLLTKESFGQNLNQNDFKYNFWSNVCR